MMVTYFRTILSIAIEPGLEKLITKLSNLVPLIEKNVSIPILSAQNYKVSSLARD